MLSTRDDAFKRAAVEIETLDPFRRAFEAAGPLGSGYIHVQDPANAFFSGEKFAGGMTPVRITALDYYSLRARSAELFDENLYARGLIRRLVGSIISTGLMLEATPVESVTGQTEDAAADWAEEIETHFGLWAATARVCDQRQEKRFAALQAEALQEAIVNGDILVLLRVPRDGTGLPRVEFINGNRVSTPIGKQGRGKDIVHGVEIDKQGRHVAYWVENERETGHVRVPAWGEKSGRRVAFLLYGTDKRRDRTRGEPLLSIVLQSMQELDRYRDAEQRAAAINALVAMFVTKEGPGLGTRPLSGGAVKRGAVDVSQPDGTTRKFGLAGMVPGLAFEELAQGEQVKSFDTKRPNANYAEFESAVINAVAWANEVPPEVLTLAFNSNYSASKTAVSQFREFVIRRREDFGQEFCAPFFVEWLLAQARKSRLDLASALDARRSRDWETFAAWTANTWSGPITPSIELLKDVKAYAEAIKAGACTRDRMSKDLFGVRFRRVVKKLKRENELMSEANEPLAPAMPAPGEGDGDGNNEPGSGNNNGLEPGQKAEVLRLIEEELEALYDEREAA